MTDQTSRNLRQQVLDAYGCRCACCGETEPKFLALDHIGGGGNEHRRRVGRGGYAVYREVRRMGFPKDRYRLLCHNCNLAIGFYGSCPHQPVEAAAAPRAGITPGTLPRQGRQWSEFKKRAWSAATKARIADTPPEVREEWQRKGREAYYAKHPERRPT